MISIITATYNSGATVEDTIKSVLAQTYADWEHIIVDGASSDSTLEIVERYRHQYGGRLRLVSERDCGIYDAMNKGLRMARGEYVGILNSDDFYTCDDVLERTASAFADDRALDAVYGDIMYVDAADTSRMVRYYSSAGFRRWKMRMGFMPAHPSFYCRREVYDRCGCFDLTFRIAADFENLLRLIYKGRARCRYLPMNFVTMREGGASSSGFASHRRIIADHMRAYRKSGVYSGYFLDWLRYPYRIAEAVSFRLHQKRNKL